MAATSPISEAEEGTGPPRGVEQIILNSVLFADTISTREMLSGGVTVLNRKKAAPAICAALISLAAMAQHQAMAEFGQPTQAADIGLFKSLRNNPQPGQLQEVMELVKAHLAQMKPIDEPLRAIRGQITDQLSGSGVVNVTELDALAQQALALRAQEDTLNLAEQVELRAMMTPAQIAAAAELHQHAVALNAQDWGWKARRHTRQVCTGRVICSGTGSAIHAA
jgi:hypothetical protein